MKRLSVDIEDELHNEFCGRIRLRGKTVKEVIESFVKKWIKEDEKRK